MDLIGIAKNTPLWLWVGKDLLNKDPAAQTIKKLFITCDDSRKTSIP